MGLLAIGSLLLIVSLILIIAPYMLTEYRVDRVNIEIQLSEDGFLKPFDELIRLPGGYKELVGLNISIGSICYREINITIHYNIYSRTSLILNPNESIKPVITDLSNFIEARGPSSGILTINETVEYYLNQYIWMFAPAFIMGIAGGLILIRHIIYRSSRRI